MVHPTTLWARRNPGKKAAIRARHNAKARANPEKLERIRAGNRAYLQRLRDAAFEAYGGFECVCCGETERLFLSIDHINNDGNAHRKILDPARRGRGAGAAFFCWLKREKYPPGFQVLCMNCNMGKARNAGVCPHKRTSVPLP